MATRKPLVIVSGVTQQIADADAISANGGVQRGTAGALALGTDANTTSVNLGTNAAVTAISIGTGMGVGDTIQIGGGGIGGALTRVMLTRPGAWSQASNGAGGKGEQSGLHGGAFHDGQSG